jgi:Zn-dependent M16 (insulinase) family peptidase
LDIYFDSFYSLPLVDATTGKETPFEEVVKHLDQDTVSRACGVGVGGMFRQLALVILKTERAKYSEGIAWLQKMTWHTRFDVERLKVIATKLLNDIPQQKRDGSRVSNSFLRERRKRDSCNIGIARSQHYLKLFPFVGGRCPRPAWTSSPMTMTSPTLRP